MKSGGLPEPMFGRFGDRRRFCRLDIRQEDASEQRRSQQRKNEDDAEHGEQNDEAAAQ